MCFAALLTLLAQVNNKFNFKFVFIFQVPDVGAELTGGCYGFAAKYMHWPEDLVVGGTKKNKTGHITK